MWWQNSKQREPELFKVLVSVDGVTTTSVDEQENVYVCIYKYVFGVLYLMYNCVEVVEVDKFFNSTVNEEEIDNEHLVGFDLKKYLESLYQKVPTSIEYKNSSSHIWLRT